jgi:hypothetical protein
MKFSKHLYALAIVGASVAVTNNTQAALSYTLQEVGSDVVFTLLSGGSIDLTGMSLFTSGSGTANINPSSYFTIGSGPYNLYSGFTITSGLSSIGTSSSSIFATSATGSFFGFNFSSTPALGIPVGYVSGAPVAGSTSTYTGRSFSTMGITAGTYTWTLANTDTVTLVATAATPVPEASGSVAGLGLAMAGLYQLRRRKAAGRAVES